MKRTSKRQKTPKKSSKSSTTTPKKSSKASTSKKTLKSTPNKTLAATRSPRRSRILPKSPISESMKQMKINDFFKSASLQTPSTSETSLSQSLEALKPESLNTTRKRGTKGLPKKLKPVLSSEKGYALRNGNIFVKRLKFETNDSQNDSSDEIQIIEVNEELMDTSNGDNLKLSPNETSKLSQNIGNKIINESKNLDEMMDELKIKSPINCEKTQKSSLNLCDKIVNKLSPNIDNSLDEDIDLMPVFRKPKVPKSKQNSKENINKYVDKEKEKKMSYFLKNLSRLKKDKEMLDIQPFEEIESDLNDKNEHLITKSCFLIKPFKGIDTFCGFISKQLETDLSEQTIEIDLSQFYKQLFEIPLNRLLPLIPILSKKVKESEFEALLSHIINLVLNEENPMICSQSEHKIEDLFTENDFEISLSLILRDFNRILSKISKNFNNLTQNQIDCNEINSETQKLLFFVSNFLRFMSLVFSKCSFKIEAIDSDKELTKLLISGFAIGLDYRVIKDSHQLIEIKKFIGVILKHLCIDEFKANSIIESLISFCDSDQKTDINLSLQIASLFPMNIEFQLKRKFCISIIKLFVPKVLNKFELNFNGINDILNEIQWKGLSAEEIYIIIQMIGLSMDLPEDLIDHKETIGSVLSTLDNKINSSVPKSSELEFTEIHKLLMILRSKVNVSTKRF